MVSRDHYLSGPSICATAKSSRAAAIREQEMKLYLAPSGAQVTIDMRGVKSSQRWARDSLPDQHSTKNFFNGCGLTRQAGNLWLADGPDLTSA